MVVVADLCRPLFTFQPQFLADEPVAEGTPVILRISHVMGVEVARGTAELGRQFAAAQGCELLGQAIDIDLNLLAQSGGGGRLSMCLRQHRHILPFPGVFLQLCDQFLDLRIKHLFECFLY